MSGDPVVPALSVTSPSNPRVKNLVALRRRRVREQEGLTLIEGFEELSLALDAGVRPVTLYYCPELVTEPARLTLIAQVAALGSEIVRMSRAVFQKAAYREGPDGWLAVVPAVSGRLTDLRPGSGLLLVCQGVEKPGNLGAMLRTADAAGLAGVIAADPVTDWGNPNVVRASKGTVFSVPVAAAPSHEVLDWLTEHGVTMAVTTPDTSMTYTDADLTGPLAVVVGSEKYGVPPEWLDRADLRLRIPMAGSANSLNVATSAAIVLYEAVRQRR